MQDSEARSSLVLIVEDIDWLRSAMTNSLERLGYRTAQATDDAEAFAVVEREPIDRRRCEERLQPFTLQAIQLATTQARQGEWLDHKPDAETGE